MTTIKCRAWDLDTQDRMYGWDEIKHTLNEHIEHERVVVMKYTGLKDVNGVEIYEGDLVEHDDFIDGEWRTYQENEIVYDQEHAMFCFKFDVPNPLATYRNLKVVGNIYENGAELS